MCRYYTYRYIFRFSWSQVYTSGLECTYELSSISHVPSQHLIFILACLDLNVRVAANVILTFRSCVVWQVRNWARRTARCPPRTQQYSRDPTTESSRRLLTSMGWARLLPLSSYRLPKAAKIFLRTMTRSSFGKLAMDWSNSRLSPEFRFTPLSCSYEAFLGESALDAEFV